MVRLTTFLSAVLFAATLWANNAHAQEYPTKPVRLVVPWIAGGGTDIVARIIGQKLSDGLGQPIIIDNRPGANGILGAQIAAKSAPDGYTMVLHAVEHFINPSVYAKLPYETIKDFDPVTMVGTHYLVLIVSPSAPLKSVNDVVSLGKAKPGHLTFGSWGDGSLAHLTAELLKNMAKITATHVPYKSAPGAATDIIAGRLNFGFTTMPTGLPFIKAGKLQPLAVTSTKRVTYMPDVPTMIELGYPGFEVQSWRALFVPAGTPKSTIAKLHENAVKVIQMPETQERLQNAGYDPVTSTPQQLGTFSRAEHAKWAKVVKEAGIKVE